MTAVWPWLFRFCGFDVDEVESVEIVKKRPTFC